MIGVRAMSEEQLYPLMSLWEAAHAAIVELANEIERSDQAWHKDLDMSMFQLESQFRCLHGDWKIAALKDGRMNLPGGNHG